MDRFQREILKDEADLRVLRQDLCKDAFELAADRALEVAELDDRDFGASAGPLEAAPSRWIWLSMSAKGSTFMSSSSPRNMYRPSLLTKTTAESDPPWAETITVL